MAATVVVARRVPRVDGPLCSEQDCDRTLDAKGMCSMHYRRWRRYGTTSLLAARLRERIHLAPNGCWLQHPSLAASTEYGARLKINGRAFPVNRAAYIAFGGPLADDLRPERICESFGCVNPEHMQLVRRMTWRHASFEDRFWDRVEKSAGCWLWRGTRDPNGYGQLMRSGVRVHAHRTAYELQRGPITDGLWVLHRCDTPSCVRGDHLFLGTPQDNVDDMIRKGRGHFSSSSNVAVAHDRRRARRRATDRLIAAHVGEYDQLLAEELA